MANGDGNGGDGGGGLTFQPGGGNFDLFNRLLNSIFGSGASSNIQGTEMGAQYGSLLGPWGTAIGAGIGGLYDLFSGLFGGGVPREAKTTGAAQELIGSRDREKALLGRYIQQQGGLLSEPSAIKNIDAMADAIQYLSGKQFAGLQNMPAHKGVGELIEPPPPGAPYGRNVGISGILNRQGLNWLDKGLPGSPHLNWAQIRQLMPLIEQQIKQLGDRPLDPATFREIITRAMRHLGGGGGGGGGGGAGNGFPHSPPPPRDTQRPGQEQPNVGALFGGGGSWLTQPAFKPPGFGVSQLSPQTPEFGRFLSQLMSNLNFSPSGVS